MLLESGQLCSTSTVYLLENEKQVFVAAVYKLLRSQSNTINSGIESLHLLSSWSIQFRYVILVFKLSWMTLIWRKKYPDFFSKNGCSFSHKINKSNLSRFLKAISPVKFQIYFDSTSDIASFLPLDNNCWPDTIEKKSFSLWMHLKISRFSKSVNNKLHIKYKT